MMRVGLIGLGQMGLPIARNLLNKGFNVVAYDITRAKVDEVAKLGAEEAAGLGRSQVRVNSSSRF